MAISQWRRFATTVQPVDRARLTSRVPDKSIQKRVYSAGRRTISSHAAPLSARTSKVVPVPAMSILR